MNEYFEPIDKLPQRCHSENISKSVLESFLSSNVKLVKVNLSIFNNRKARDVSGSLHRYCKRFDYPIIVHCIGSQVFLEKILT
jgi:hypothetical protein